jgi:zinc protease
MKSRSMNALAAAALFALVPLAASAQVSSYKDIKTPALRAMKVEQPTRIQLDNGMVVFIQVDHELPLIRGRAIVRGGARDVAREKAGLDDVLGSVWRTGGTESKTGDQLDDFLDARAARIESSSGMDSSSLSFDILKSDLETVFPLYVDLLRHPAFREDKISVSKTQINAGISRRNDSPDSIASRELSRLGWGPDSPYSREPEYATVASITRDDLLAFHAAHVQPNNIIFGIIGDFDAKAMETIIRNAFGSWPRGTAASKIEVVAHPAKAGVYYVGKDDLTQTTIGVVGPGIMRSNPDYFAVTVMNEIFGGGFSSRAMNHLRTQKGLAYSVGGALGASWDHPGLFNAEMATKSGTTIEAATALRDEIADLRTKPFTAEEVSLAKESILNSFIFTVDSKRKLLNEKMSLEFYGYPVDFWEKYPAAIEKITPADVERVAKKYVKPEQMSILVVGRDKDFEKPLSTIGTVTNLDITIPEPGAAAPATSGTPAGSAAAAATASNAEGLAIVKKMQEFAGGKAKLASIRSTHTVGSVNATTAQGAMNMEIDSTTVYPDREHTTMKLPMGEMTMVMTPEAAFMVTPMGTRDMPASQKASMQRELGTELQSVLAHADEAGYIFNATGHEKVGDVDATLVSVTTPAGATMRWYVDMSTGRMLRKSTSHGAEGESVTEYSDWKMVDGLNFPMRYTVYRGTDKAATGEWKTIEVNQTVDPKIFVKPAAQQ